MNTEDKDLQKFTERLQRARAKYDIARELAAKWRRQSPGYTMDAMLVALVLTILPGCAPYEGDEDDTQGTEYSQDLRGGNPPRQLNLPDPGEWWGPCRADDTCTGGATCWQTTNQIGIEWEMCAPQAAFWDQDRVKIGLKRFPVVNGTSYSWISCTSDSDCMASYGLTCSPVLLRCGWDDAVDEDCSDGIDNDGNGFTDCADFACSDDEAC